MKATMSVRALVALASLAALPLVALAGPMTPPPGAPAPTMKPLSDVEPRIAINATNTPGDSDASPSLYKITMPDSYYLTGNVMGVAGKAGIEITTIGVTIDLNGFQLIGVPGTSSAVSASGPQMNITLRNGAIRNWGFSGVEMSGTTSGTLVSDVHVSGCTMAGIFVGVNGVVSRCTAALNGTTGIIAGPGGVIEDCSSYQNGGDGFQIGWGGTLSESSARYNEDNGIYAIGGNLVRDCSVTHSGSYGIYVGNSCRIVGNTFSYSHTGIRVQGSANHIESNNFVNGTKGVYVATGGNFLTRNAASGNTTNWDVVAGNTCLVVNSSKNAAIYGSSGGVAPGSTDPNANFSY